jgi:hypothetical protein
MIIESHATAIFSYIRCAVAAAPKKKLATSGKSPAYIQHRKN